MQSPQPLAFSILALAVAIGAAFGFPGKFYAAENSQLTAIVAVQQSEILLLKKELKFLWQATSPATIGACTHCL